MAAIVGPPSRTTSSPAPAPTPAPSQPQTQTYFDIVTSSLLKLGALTLEDFLRDPYQEPTPQENFLSNPLYHDVPVAPPLVLDDDQDGGENGKPTHTPAPIFVLHQICSQTFGSIDALDYEIIEEEGKESGSLSSLLIKRPTHRFFPSFPSTFSVEKRCILTITRPNGATRSYTSKPEFSRKAEARAAAAAVAVDMGAIDFIKHGSPEAVAKRGLVLAPLDAPGSVETSSNDAEEDPAVKEIEKCCVEWRAGRVKPRWIFLIDSKPNGSESSFPPSLPSPHAFRVSWFELFTMDLGENNTRLWMCATGQTLDAPLPRLLGRCGSPNFRSGQSYVRRRRDLRGNLGLYQVRKRTDYSGREAPLSRRRYDVRSTAGRAHLAGILRGPPTSIAGARRRQDGGRDQCAGLAERPLTVCAWRKVRAQVHLDDRHKTRQYVFFSH